MPINNHPLLPPAESLAERFRVLMRAPGRTITVVSAFSVRIASEEGTDVLLQNARTSASILHCTVERSGTQFNLRRLP